MFQNFLKLIMCLLLCIAVVSPSADAQEYGTIQALATVVTSLMVVGSSDLQFGAVTPGINKSIDKSLVGPAGEWRISGVANAEVSIDFTLPDSLVTADSLAYMRVSFSNTDASWDNGTAGGQTVPAGILDPSNFAILDIGIAATLSIWIGGTVFPALSQTGGDYASDIILTVSYTGN